MHVPDSTSVAGPHALRGVRPQTAELLMYAALLVSYILNAMDRQLFAVVAIEVRKAMDLSLQEVGYASTVFTLGMGLAGLPTAYLMSRHSRRSVSLVGLAIFSLATLLTAYAQSFPQLLLWRFVSGVGEAMQFTAILAIGTTYFHRHRAMATGALNFCFGIGAIIGPNLGAALLKSHGWQMPFVAYGLAALPVGLLIAFAVKARFSEMEIPRPPSASNGGQASSRTWSGTTVLLGLATALIGLVVYGYLGLYPTFLREALGFSPTQAAFAVSFYGLGAFASLLGGWLGDRYDHGKLLMWGCLSSGAAGVLLFTELGGSLALHALMSFIFGVSLSAIVFVNLAASIIKSTQSAYGAGLFVVCLYVPASFAGYALGMLRNLMGWSSAATLQLGLLALVAALLAFASSSRRSATAVPHAAANR